MTRPVSASRPGATGGRRACIRAEYGSLPAMSRHRRSIVFTGSKCVCVMVPAHDIGRSVLVGSDLSGASDQVVREAARLAEATNSELHVISAFGEVSGSMRSSSGDVAESVVDEARKALPTQLRRVLPESLRPASQTVRFGRASAVILTRAREVNADLIVLGPHRGTGVQAQFLGTTADAVLTESTIPCLVVPSRINLPFHLIGVAVDLTEPARTTLERVLEFTAWTGAEALVGNSERGEIRVVVLHVARSPTTADQLGSRDRLRRLREEIAARRGTENSIELEDHLLIGRDPSAAVVSWAFAENTDLLAVGTRDRPKVQGSHLGSVSSAIARRARCPVLLIPPAA